MMLPHGKKTGHLFCLVIKIMILLGYSKIITVDSKSYNS